MSNFKLIALFGSFSVSQLATLAKAGWQALTTDHPTENGVVDAALKAELRVATERAAWNVLDHELSVVKQRARRDTGEIEDYNSNAGYVRDVLIVSRVAAVLIGQGVAPARLKLIQEAAAQHDRPVRQLEPEVPIYDRATIEKELNELDFGTPAPKKRRKNSEEPAPF